MAETGKKAADNTAATQGPPANQAVDGAAVEAVRNEAPNTPDESRNASVKVTCQWPNTNFIVSDSVPEITDQGTLLTKGQLAEAEKAAEASGVSLTVEEVK